MDMQEFGAQIREQRKKRGITQQKIADALHMSRATISLIETGGIPEIGIRKFSDVCDYVGLTLQLTPFHRPTLDELLAKNQKQRATDLETTSRMLTGK